ncbi:5'/3'-nucleotidase SurE [Chitinasiproducens palmae]|uniref:5'/3'-nucleotidase SurE n=1 Tax=Chitinasiproducens palmae TaxID=1770053 RepID=UPI001F376CDA|nr:5'/3'-nucleotidase SurE [Chitinasiproducens palmae]
MPDRAPLLDRVLLTNDDGIDAPGLAVLSEIAHEIAREVWIVAPDHDQSGTSHSLSLHAPLRMTRHGERRFSVSGTPGDSVVMGVRHLMDGVLPDLVLSGVNRGGNLGIETVFSGTVGAAMTAMLLGLPAIAMSQTFRDRNAVPWDVARRHGADVVARLWRSPWRERGGSIINVNFPSVPVDAVGPLTLTRQGPGLLHDIGARLHTDPRGMPYAWLELARGPRPNPDDSETAVVGRGAISATPLQFERTDPAAYAALAEALGGPSPAA